MYLFKSECLKPGISIPLSSVPGELVYEKVKPTEGGFVFKLSDVLFWRWR